ncbi:hypothetical protein MNBD_ALPHA04-295, partial [hydrothermal vent metagenome]
MNNTHKIGHIQTYPLTIYRHDYKMTGTDLKLRKTASTILRLIVEETGRHHSGLMPEGLAKPDYIRTAYAPDDLKHLLLNAIYS